MYKSTPNQLFGVLLSQRYSLAESTDQPDWTREADLEVGQVDKVAQTSALDNFVHLSKL